MGTTTSVALAIMVMVVATQVSRLGPLMLSEIKFSKSFEKWLSHVPIGILAALIIPEFISRGERGFEYNYLFIVATVLCFTLGVKTRNLMLTTTVGVIVVALLRYSGLF